MDATRRDPGRHPTTPAGPGSSPARPGVAEAPAASWAASWATSRAAPSWTLVLPILAAVFLCCAQAALGASFTLEDGRRIEGEIVYARGSTLMIRDADGALVQVGRSAVERVELEAGERGLVAGALKGWDQGVYEIDTPDSILKVKDRKIVAERRVLPKITVTAAEGRENAAAVVFELGLSKPAKDEVLLIYSTADGTAMAGTDYEPARGSVILKPGTTSAKVSVTLLDDQLVEGEESFELLVTSDMDLSEVKVHRAAAKILDDEPPQAAQQ